MDVGKSYFVDSRNLHWGWLWLLHDTEEGESIGNLTYIYWTTVRIYSLQITGNTPNTE